MSHTVTPQQRDDMVLLCRMIKSAQGKWIQAKDLTILARQHAGKAWHRRYIAELADMAAGRIISTTQGYKLQDTATDKEILRSYHQLIDKAQTTGKRASAIMSYFHRQRMGPKSTDPVATKEVQETLF